MTEHTNSSEVDTDLAPVIVYGIDDEKNPRAGYFDSNEAALAVKAADSMKLKAAKVASNELAKLVSELPAGHVYEKGRKFIPIVRRGLYEKLISAATGKTNKTKRTSKRSTNNPHVLPASWPDIQQGHLVIAQESAKDGWWEAVVVAVVGDMLTLRWRDYPKYPRLMRHRNSVALLKSSDPKIQP
jgi:hypothetical protein